MVKSYPFSRKSRFALAPDVILQRFEQKALLVDLSGERLLSWRRRPGMARRDARDRRAFGAGDRRCQFV